MAASEYDTAPFHNQIVSFPLVRNAHLSLKLVFDIVRSIFAWMQVNGKTVALVHCANGVSRTSVIVACYLRFANIVDSAQEVWK